MARRTGDTTRVLFEMLSKPPGITTYLFISRNIFHARTVFRMFIDILEKLNFSHTANFSTLTVKNNGRTFIFTVVKEDNIGLRGISDCIVFFDDYTYP